jgi:PAS domain S-box-containing protein
MNDSPELWLPAGVTSRSGRPDSQARLEALFSQPAVGVVEASADGRFIRANDRFFEMVGRGPDELIGRHILEITHPEDAAENRKRFERLIEGDEPFSMEKRYVRPDGSAVWVQIYGSPVKVNGETVSAIAVALDTTNRKHAEHSELRFRTVFENAAVGMIEIDADWRILGANAAYSEITGYALSGLVGKSSLAFTHPDDVAASEAGLKSVAQPGTDRMSFEKRYIRKDGRTVWIRSNLSKVSGQGEPARFLKVVEDITAVREAQDALEEERRRLETLNRTGAALSGELELTKLVQMVTDAGVELTDAAFGAFFYNVLDDRGEAYLLYTLSGADRSQFEKFGMPRNTAVFHPTFSGAGVVRSDDITKDPRYGKNPPHHGKPKGHLPVVSYLAVPVISRSGEVIGGLFFGHPEPGRFTESHEQLLVGLAAQAAIGIDNARLYQAVNQANETLEQRVRERTAELEGANEALRQAQKMEAIGQLTGGIAHDFNNMLTVIRGSADVLRRRDLEEEKRDRYLDAISETADRAARLTSQLLAFARRQALKPEVFDAATRVRGIAEMLATVLGSRIKLEIKAECDDCYIEADAAQFETALVNMAVNARDAMNGEGKLAIEIGRLEELPPSLMTEGAARYVAISVRDTGQGISEDDLARIFEPFFTTKEIGRGTGLGLSQVYGFAKQSGGEIEVRSKVGEGSTFTLYLQEATKAPAVQSRTDTAAPELPPGSRVLVVEDNDDVGRFAEQILIELGFTVRRAGGADEALRLLDEEDSFDVVFTDVVMPGMDGIEFAQEIRKRWPNMPVVLTSGYSQAATAQAAHGFPLLQKPYALEALQAALVKALQQ